MKVIFRLSVQDSITGNYLKKVHPGMFQTPDRHDKRITLEAMALRVIRKINELKKQSVGILMATHSPDHAFMVASKVIMIHDGVLYKSGIPNATITSENLKNIYGIDVNVFDTCECRKVCVPVIN